MVDDFTRDIRDGIARTGVKAAFLKCVVEAKGLTEGEKRNLRACAATHRDTGAPITVHTSVSNKAGLLALQVFRDEGVDLTKGVIGHAGDSNDLDYLSELADAGCLLGMDRFGLDIYNPTSSRVDTIAAPAERGSADRMALAHDASCYIDYFPGRRSAGRQADRAELELQPHQQGRPADAARAGNDRGADPADA